MALKKNTTEQAAAQLSDVDILRTALEKIATVPCILAVVGRTACSGEHICISCIARQALLDAGMRTS